MLLATAAIVALVAVSFGVGWAVSTTDERTGVQHQPEVARLKPLPVPRVIIPNGPWADPHPPVHAPPPIPPGLFPGLGWLLGLSPGSGLETGQP